MSLIVVILLTNRLILTIAGPSVERGQSTLTLYQDITQVTLRLDREKTNSPNLGLKHYPEYIIIYLLMNNCY